MIEMPYKIKKTPKGYGVWNIEKKLWKSYDTTQLKAEKQKRLLEWLDVYKDKKE
ncbi:MAG TPA: hypothetical protein V6C58_09285 [Allocoleopsis sp.]